MLTEFCDLRLPNVGGTPCGELIQKNSGETTEFLFLTFQPVKLAFKHSCGRAGCQR